MRLNSHRTRKRFSHIGRSLMKLRDTFNMRANAGVQRSGRRPLELIKLKHLLCLSFHIVCISFKMQSLPFNVHRTSMQLSDVRSSLMNSKIVYNIRAERGVQRSGCLPLQLIQLKHFVLILLHIVLVSNQCHDIWTEQANNYPTLAAHSWHW